MRNHKAAPLLIVLMLFSMRSGDAETVVVRAGRLLDVSNQKVLLDQAIVIDAGRISAIRPWSDFPIAKGFQTIDMKDATVLPGLIDCHTHLLTENDIHQGFGDPNMILTVTQMSTAKRALLGARVAKEVLQAGITTVRDLGNSGWGGDLALRDAIEAGWVAGPRMLVSTRALSPPGGQFGPLAPEAQSLIAQEYVQITGVDEARRAVRQAFYDGADCIKIIVGQNGRWLSVEEMKAIVEEAHRGDRGGYPWHPVAAHAVTDMEVRFAVEAGVDSVEHGYQVSDDTLKLMADKKIFFVPTDESITDPILPEIAKQLSIPLQTLLDRGKSYRESQYNRLQKAIDLGVTIATGSDSYIARPGMSRGQAALLVLKAYHEAGLNNWQILRASTIEASRLLGLSNRIGSLQPGYSADMIAVSGDPLVNIDALQRLRFVMKAGQVIVSKP